MLINGGETEFYVAASISSTLGNLNAQFYTDIACTTPVGSTFTVTPSTASIQAKVPGGAKGVVITGIDISSDWSDIYINAITLKS